MTTSTKTPRELLRETLDKNARELAGWPDWMHQAISTSAVFHVPTRSEGEPVRQVEAPAMREPERK